MAVEGMQHGFDILAAMLGGMFGEGD